MKAEKNHARKPYDKAYLDRLIEKASPDLKGVNIEEWISEFRGTGEFLEGYRDTDVLADATKELMSRRANQKASN
jgi:hypothetical protein